MTSRSSEVRRARPLLGTFVEIAASGLREDAAHRAIDAAFATIEEVQRRMSFHDPESTLSRLNREAADRPVQVDAWTFTVLSAAARVHRISAGAFDVTIAPRLQALGFLPGHQAGVRPSAQRSSCPIEKRMIRREQAPVGEAASFPTTRSVLPAKSGAAVAGIGKLAASPTDGHSAPSVLSWTGRSPMSFADVELLPERRVRFHRPDVALDLGGIAKGFAVDRAVAALRRAGVPRGVVNAGGDLRAFGGEQRVALRHPDQPQAVYRELPLRDAAIATSAHYFAESWQEGQTLAPIIEPRTGKQFSQVRSVTVRARTAMLADALTKVVTLRAEAALPVLNHFRADAIFVSASGEEKCTPRWYAALQLSS